MENKYYLPIKAENLAIYFSSACIYPVRAIKNRNNDIQSEFPDFLLLTLKQAIGNTDCCLEIILTNEEKKLLESLSTECWLYPKPLPITRVKQILFDNKDLLMQTHTVIELNTAFIPKTLLDIVDSFSIAKKPKKTKLKSTPVDWSNKLRNFDQILGGIALMRLATNNGMNYSENYFSMLARYNEVIKQEIINSKQEIKSLYKGGYYDRLNKYIITTIDQKIVENIAKEENQKITIDKYSRKIVIDNLNQATYILAILNDYKAFDFDNGRDNIDGLIINRFNNIKNGEEVAFYYGFNRGYSIFSKKYKDIEFKYKLDSQLDYYTIESVYQKSINGVETSSEFLYLDNWCPNKSNDIKIVSDSQYIILDTVVFKKKEIIIKESQPIVGSTEWWNNIFLTFLDKIWKQFWEKGKDGLKAGIKEIVEKAISDKMVEIQQTEITKKSNILNEPSASYQTIQNRIKELEKMNIEQSLKIQELEEQVLNCKPNKVSFKKAPKKKNESKQLDSELFND